MKTFLVTAANGHTGFPAAKELLQLGHRVRAFVRDPLNPKAQALEKGGAELFVGDIEDIRDVRKALQGVEGAYFVPTYPNVLFQGSTFVAALEEAYTPHVVLLTQWISSNTHYSRYTKEHWLVDGAFQRLQHTKLTVLNPGLFAFVYFMMPEPMLQFGIMPDFGTNAPPSNEDIGLVAAHVLHHPAPHAGQTYRITSRELLRPQEMAAVVGNVLGRKVAVQKLPESMMLKMFRAKGFPQVDASQARYYIKEAQQGGFAMGAPTTVVKDIVGKEADDFETIARRYLKDHPMLRQSLSNKISTMGLMMKSMFTPLWNMDRFEKEQGFPRLKNMMFSNESEEWRAFHQHQISNPGLKIAHAELG